MGTRRCTEVGVGARVRVKQEIEDIVKIVSRITGYARFSIRNYALLKGLSLILEDYIAQHLFLVIDDETFETLIELVREKAERAQKEFKKELEIIGEDRRKERGDEL